MCHTFKLLVFFLWCTFNTNAAEILGESGNSPPLQLQPDMFLRRTADYYIPDSTNPLESSNTPKPDKPLKTPRGFSDFVSDDRNRLHSGMNFENSGWSPYSLPERRDSAYESGSSSDMNSYRRQDDRSPGRNPDFSGFPGFSPDYTDMMLMMQAMKKMDTGAQRPGILTRILDNPATLVMATFIPISLIIAAALPLLVNVMMNGITIPAILPTTAGKARSLELPAADFLLPILDGLADLGTKYLENPDCVQRVFCHAATKNTTSRSHPNYIKQATDVAMRVSNEEVLDLFGVKPLIFAIRDRKCDSLPCGKVDSKSKLKLSRFMSDVMFNQSQKKKPKLM